MGFLVLFGVLNEFVVVSVVLVIGVLLKFILKFVVGEKIGFCDVLRFGF